MTLLEGTLNTERFSKYVELELLSVGNFIFSAPPCLVYSGEGGYYCLAPCMYNVYTNGITVTPVSQAMVKARLHGHLHH